MSSSVIEVLLRSIDEAFDHKSWHGTNLKGSLKGLSADQAAWRPHPARHNIWEIAVHAAYWKYVVRRRLRSEARGTFPLKGSNWIVRPAAEAFSEANWKSDVRLLIDTHESLRDAIAALKPKDLDHVPQESKVSNLSLITGISAHDLYHAGQIQLLKRLQAG